MKNSTFKKIINDSQQEILKLAKKNGWVWFYNLHQKEVVKCAEKLLKLYKKTNRRIVLVSCWLHDIAYYYTKSDKEILKTKTNHHIESAKITENFLRKYKLTKEEINEIKNCILKHRNSPPHIPKTLEEKIVTVADTLSHFESIFYLTYFKFHPKHSLEEMVEKDLIKLKRDWRDLQLLPEAKKLAEMKYKTLKKLLENYRK